MIVETYSKGLVVNFIFADVCSSSDDGHLFFYCIWSASANNVHPIARAIYLGTGVAGRALAAARLAGAVGAGAGGVGAGHCGRRLDWIGER